MREFVNLVICLGYGYNILNLGAIFASFIHPRRLERHCHRVLDYVLVRIKDGLVYLVFIAALGSTSSTS